MRYSPGMPPAGSYRWITPPCCSTWATRPGMSKRAWPPTSPPTCRTVTPGSICASTARASTWPSPTPMYLSSGPGQSSKPGPASSRSGRPPSRSRAPGTAKESGTTNR
ncbi:hypothetical protein ACFPRL_06595 [Pseudoclavibacter helvolus]